MRLLKRQRQRMLVIGLDCVPPDLIFDAFTPYLPNINRLRERSIYGTLTSSIPCITIPAWSSMLTGHDAGQLGIYGFRNRPAYDYQALQAVDARAVHVPRVWDELGKHGKRVILLGIPQTYPPSPVNGDLVTDFLTPSTAVAFTYPAILKQEILQRTPDYGFDVRGFRTDDKARLLQQLYDLTEVQFDTFHHLIQTRDWDFAMMVNIGTDRIHHGFWRYHDPKHRLHESESIFTHAIRDYYQRVDRLIGKLLASIGEEVSVLLVSDHGAKRMDGGIALNQWLIEQGWLVLHNPPPTGTLTPFDELAVDWSKTRAWAAGGYYARVFLNVAEREPNGVILPADYERVCNELSDAIRAIPDAHGQPIPTQVFRPQFIYAETKGVPPDLMVYFGDLHWRAIGSLGHPNLHTLSNDTGPDDANHSQEGMFLLHAPQRKGAVNRTASILDIAPTILDFFNVKPTGRLRGKSIR